MRQLLKEPLVHFLVLGALVFAGYGLLNRNGEPAPGRIVITQGQLASMRKTFILTWQRPPTREEWEGVVQERVREEVYCREALALGLDKDDSVIRRRLRQKMEFVSEDVAAGAPPTDDQLNAYLQAHPEKFRVEQQFTFRQLYLNPKKRGDNLARDTAQLLAKLNQPGSSAGFAAMGDPFMLDPSFTAVPASEITKQFGGKFTANLGQISPGQWQGPVESGFGVHLVFLAERTTGRLPSLQEVREAVRREWDSDHRLEANQRIYQDMLKRYTVTIESTETVQARPSAASPK